MYLYRKLVLIFLVTFMLALSTAQAKTTITFFHWDNEKTPVERGIALFEAENPDIDVEVVYIARGEYDQKIITMAAGGVDMDVLYVPENKFAPWAHMGWLYDITNNLRNEKLDDDFLPAEKMRSSINGRWYGIGLTWNVFQLFYNPDMLNESGVPLPSAQAAKAWTWNQFSEAARKLHKVKADGTITCWGAQFPPNIIVLASLLLSNNSSFFNSVGDGVLIDSPGSIQVFDAISEIYNIRKVARNAGSADLITGKTAMALAGSPQLGTVFKGTSFKPSVAALPAFTSPASFIYGPYHGIYSKTKHPAEAWRLFRFLISEQYAEMWVGDGVWTPTRKSFMSRAKLQVMTKQDVHPEKYLEDTMNYISQAGHAQPYPIGWETAATLFNQQVGPIFSGKSPAQQILPDLAKQINVAIAEAIKTLKTK